jgi:hypothetical protein
MGQICWPANEIQPYFFIAHRLLERCEKVVAQRHFVGLAYQDEDIVFRFIIENSSLRDLGP